jgi:superfamily II DNA or RNA helicase
MDYRRAIQDNIVAHFAVALIGVRFSADELASYEQLSTEAGKMRRELVNYHGVPAEPFGEFMKQVGWLAEGPKGPGRLAARRFVSAFNKRRQLLAETPAKMRAVRQVSPAIRAARRTIVFTETIEGAAGVVRGLAGEGIRAQEIHSDMDMPTRRRVLADFESGRLSVVVAPKVLDEGIDVPEADLALIVAASKTKRQMIQRMGRVLRRKKDQRLARFGVLFVEGTSEDPANGAREDFLEEITEVADSMATFASSDGGTHASQFLSDIQSTRPLGLPRLASATSRGI